MKYFLFILLFSVSLSSYSSDAELTSETEPKNYYQNIVFEILKVGIANGDNPESIVNKMASFIKEIDINAINKVHKSYDGQTLLMMSTKVCSQELFMFLLENGANDKQVEARGVFSGYGAPKKLGRKTAKDMAFANSDVCGVLFIGAVAMCKVN